MTLTLNDIRRMKARKRSFDKLMKAAYKESPEPIDLKELIKTFLAIVKRRKADGCCPPTGIVEFYGPAMAGMIATMRKRRRRSK